MGGRSSEHEVSLASGTSVAAGLREGGHEVVEVLLTRDGAWHADGEALVLRPGGGLLGCDVVFPVLHGPFGEDGTVQGLLELLDVAYVGSGVLASAVCMDKVVFKDVMAQHDIAQVPYALLERTTAATVLEDLGFPCWVKPARLGSSVGIVKVRSADDVEAALETAWAHDHRVIAEGHAGGLEIECSVLGHPDAPAVSALGEIAYDAEWYDYETKYTPGLMELVVPARISETAGERVRALAAQAFAAAGCSGLARADFFVDGETVLLNELNTMPGQTRTSVYGKLWAASGLPYAQLVERLCEIARERFAAERTVRY
jgi:D-alanine-D-alanine ligase